MNVSLFNESVKNKQYEDAYEPWWSVYQTCPNANKAIYTQGAKIVEYLYNKTTDPAEKDRLRQLIMEMYDKRIKYFGDDARYPTAYILGQKALDYCSFFENDTLKKPAYEWLKQSVEGMKEKSQTAVLVKYVELSYGMYKADPNIHGEQFIADYALANGYLQTIAADPANKNAAIAQQQKEYIDNLFAASGAADCYKLDELFEKLVETEQANLEVMSKIMKLYKRVDCTESTIYFKAAAAVHKLQPTSESAAGCAKLSIMQDDLQRAIDYYKEAIALIDNTPAEERDADALQDKSNYQYNIALLSFRQSRYQEARTYALQSLEYPANQGRCYILIGLCYASSHPYSGSDYPAAKAAILNKTVYWVAVDKFQKAKQVDSSVAELASKYIIDYSRYFPTKEEIFDLPNEFGGGTFVVGGWINEKTTCRPAR